MVKILHFIAGTLVSINFLPQIVFKEPQRMPSWSLRFSGLF